MPLQRPTLSELETRIFSQLDTQLPDTDSRLTRSEENALAAAQAGGLHELWGYLIWIQRQSFVTTADAGPGLDTLHGSKWGITRKGANQATGTVTFTGTTGSPIPLGTLVQRSDASQYETTAGGVLVGGTAVVAVRAVIPGLSGNLDTGASLTLASPLAGVNSTSTGGALTGGTDAEGDEDYRARILARIQNAPQGGSLADWTAWTLEVAGVTRAFVTGPETNGGGSVTVYFMMDNTYTNGIPLAGDVATVLAHLVAPTRKPITAEALVFAPVAAPLNFNIQLNPNTLPVQTAVDAALRDLIRRQATPGGTLLISQVREAISTSVGEVDHVLVAPVANTTTSAGNITTLGTRTYGVIP